MEKHPSVELSEDEVARAVRAGLDARAVADELVRRYAGPDERKEVASRINPATAAVFFIYAETLDPYGDDHELPDEYCQIGREYFAVDPSEGVAVWFYDLSEVTQEALAEKRRAADAAGWRRLLEET